MYKQEIIYDKPIYVGTSILDLSKLHMMNFHYNVINKEFEDKYNLVYSDTDSFVYNIEHPDIYGLVIISTTLIYPTVKINKFRIILTRKCLECLRMN